MSPSLKNRPTFTALALLVTALTASAQTPRYEFIDLGAVPGVAFRTVSDINDRGVIVGTTTTPNGNRPATWSPSSGFQVLSGFNVGAIGTAINNQGQVAGTLETQEVEAFRWDAGTVTPLGRIGTTPDSIARAINESGQVAGDSGDATGAETRIFFAVPFLFSGGALTSVGPQQNLVGGMNDAGQVVSSRTFFDGTQELPLSIPGAQFQFTSVRHNDVNNAETIVGTAIRTSGFTTAELQAFFRQGDGPATFIPMPFSRAEAINNLGDIVGRSNGETFLFSDGQAALLRDLVANLPANVRLETPFAINDRGQIVAEFSLTNGNLFETFPCLLSPVEVGTSFCTANPNSLGVATEMRALGSASVAANAFSLQASSVPAGTGLFLASTTQQAPAPLSAGFLCLGGDLALFPADVIPGSAVAEFSTDLPSALAGITLNFQYAYADVAAGVGVVNFSNGIEVTFQN